MTPGARTTRSWSRRAKRPLAVRVRAQANWRSLANRRLLAGLTTRGTVATRVPEMKSLVMDLDALAIEMSAIYELLPSSVQARCRQLASRLATVRRRLV
jgi:hypothetical protein